MFTCEGCNRVISNDDGYIKHYHIIDEMCEIECIWCYHKRIEEATKADEEFLLSEVIRTKKMPRTWYSLPSEWTKSERAFSEDNIWRVLESILETGDCLVAAKLNGGFFKMDFDVYTKPL